MSTGISLTSGMRSTLYSLQLSSSLLNRTQGRLSTGKKINSALDDPINFFAAQSHSQRANDLAALKDQMGEGIQTIKAADAGIKAITDLVASAKSLAQSALASSDATERAALATQFDGILTQIDGLAGDAGYKGTNLLADDDLTVNFNEDATSSITVAGFDATTGGTDMPIAGATNAWVDDTDISAAITELDTAKSTLRTNSQTLSNQLSTITIRDDYTSNMINTLNDGADKLTLADMNEEAANMLALQTQQQLALSALSMASASAQGVLRLF
jgi:flagellin